QTPELREANSRHCVRRNLVRHCRWGNGLRSPPASRSLATALAGARFASGLLGGRAVVPQPDGVESRSRDGPAPHHRGTTMDHYAGIDVSLEYSSICVVDATGNIVREDKIASEPEVLIAWFGSLGYALARIGLEAGPLSQW